ncbi:DUF1294 domain-containing protein [Psychrobacter aestuarii]|uniref:Cold shock and DUF1294 domain-containing protein n=1 Tax=Psychrobacter aestuarii TaxID=556327 RepID=A0ABP3FBW7_9GAMM|nr:cold shock and DUF1294 domain-containing protein [Psychrobacter aestuarii]
MSTSQSRSKHQGHVTDWQDDKGFGFIQTERNERLFFHISDFKAARCPLVGDAVVFEIGKDAKGRQRAEKVQELAFVQQKMAQKNSQIRKRNQQRSQQADFEAGQKKRLYLAIGFYVVLMVLAVSSSIPWLVVGWYIALGVVTYLMYAKDKRAAQNNGWRTPESTLHLLSAAGGWAGAMVAQTYLRHKSQKAEFRVTYYMTVLINLAGLMALMYYQPLSF